MFHKLLGNWLPKSNKNDKTLLKIIQWCNMVSLHEALPTSLIKAINLICKKYKSIITVDAL